MHVAAAIEVFMFYCFQIQKKKKKKKKKNHKFIIFVILQILFLKVNTKLIPSLTRLRDELQKKADAFDKIIKSVLTTRLFRSVH